MRRVGAVPTLSSMGGALDRRWWPGPAVHDAALATLAFVGTAMLMWDGSLAVSHPRAGRPEWWVLALAGLGAAPLVAPRRWPVAAFAASTAVYSVLVAVDEPIGVLLAPGLAVYLVASLRDAPDAGRRLASVAAGFVVYVAACGLALRSAPWSEAFHTGLLWSACWFAGERARLQRQRLDELRRDAEREHALAVAEERARIARDLHDSAGHAINVILVRAGAARLRHRDDPDRSLDALATIEAVARQTMADIDQMVGALRAEATAAEAAPVSLRSLPSLLEQHAGAGLAVELDVVGAERPLPAAIDRAAYRIVQEGLTNASRHGCGGAGLRLEFGVDELAVTIVNPVTADHGPGPGERRGHGLIGAAERAHLAGGTLSSGRLGSAFVLTARFPVGAAGAGPDPVEEVER